MEIAYKDTGGKCKVATKKEIAWSATGGQAPTKEFGTSRDKSGSQAPPINALTG